MQMTPETKPDLGVMTPTGKGEGGGSHCKEHCCGAQPCAQLLSASLRCPDKPLQHGACRHHREVTSAFFLSTSILASSVPVLRWDFVCRKHKCLMYKYEWKKVRKDFHQILASAGPHPSSMGAGSEGFFAQFRNLSMKHCCFAESKGKKKGGIGKMILSNGPQQVGAGWG